MREDKSKMIKDKKERTFLSFIFYPLSFNKGFTLIDVLIGTALLVTVFAGIFGVYQLGLKIVAQSKARVTASALANQKIEAARNMSYNDVGTIGGIPPGVLPQTENITRNGVDYVVRTTVLYIDDPFDGVAPADVLPNDYKRVRIEASWTHPFDGSVVLLTDIAPKGLETSVGGGNLLLQVFDALGIPIPQASIQVVNNQTDPAINAWYVTGDDGTVLVAGAPAATESYELLATKADFSTAQTYGTTTVANPAPPHASVLEGKLTQMSFSIDRVSTLSIETQSPFGSGSFADSFQNDNFVSASSSVLIGGGDVALATTTASTTQYVSNGSFRSITITPTNLRTWGTFSWNDSVSASTSVVYQVFDSLGILVPDGDLSGNSSGFTSSPVDLSGVSTTTYAELQLGASLATADASSTPRVLDWFVDWTTNTATPISGVSFDLRGEKTIGTDALDQPVYKYKEGHATDSNGQLTLENMEWDLYTFSVDPATTGLNLIDTVPSPQPISVAPGTTQAVSLILSAEHNALITVRSSDTAEPLFGATVRLTNGGLAYDETQFTDSSGQTFFIPLEETTYNYEVSAPGHIQKNGTLSVSGNTTAVIYITPDES